MAITLLVWARGGSDRRNEASSLATVTLADTFRGSAVALARKVDEWEETRETLEAAGHRVNVSPGYKLAYGHGVTVQYPNGRTRTVWA